MSISPVSTSFRVKQKPGPVESLARVTAGGGILASSTLYAAYKNQHQLNPTLKAPVSEVIRLGLPKQVFLKTSQLVIFIGLRRSFAETFPDYTRLATTSAYLLPSLLIQGSMYSLATRDIFKIGGYPVSPLRFYDMIRNIQVAFKPTFVREVGSTALAIATTPDVEKGLSLIMPDPLARSLSAPTAGFFCGLLTQFAHNVALTESRYASEGRIPSTVQAAKEVLRTHGVRGLALGFFPARAALIATGAVVGAKLLAPLYEDLK